MIISERIVLTYYTEDEVMAAAFPTHSGRQSVAGFSDQEVLQIFPHVVALAARDRQPQYDDERISYLRNVKHAITRLNILQAGH